MAGIFEPGARVGPYRVVSLLGKGGMSVVYLAEDTRLGRTVALKLMSEAVAEDESLRKRFLRESRLAASLDHPGIVSIYEADEADRVPYIAMRHVPGKDLRRILDEEGRLEPRRAAHLILQIADALDAAHRAGMVHRDVKPANVLVLGDPERTFLVDFGLTKRTTSASTLTATGEFMGTLDYVAPEQIQGRDVDGRADQYSLACVAYECLTGWPPFADAEEMAVLYAHLMQAPAPATKAVPELPRPVDDVLAVGLAKSRDDRFASCGDMARALAAAVEGETSPVAIPARARPEESLPVARGRAARRRGSLAVLVAVLALSAGLLALVLRGSGEDATAPFRRGAIVFEDGFDGDGSSWSLADRRISVSGGALRLDPSGRRDAVVALVRAPARNAMTVEADARLVEGDARAGFGLVCLASGPGDLYQLVVSPSGGYAIDVARDGAFSRLVIGGTDALRPGPVRLAALCDARGSAVELSLWANGTLVGRARDEQRRHTAGTAGVAAVAAAGPAAVAFDDFVLGVPARP